MENYNEMPLYLYEVLEAHRAILHDKKGNYYLRDNNAVRKLSRREFLGLVKGWMIN